MPKLMRTFFIVCLLGLPGCASVGNERVLDQNVISQIVIGTSTKEDVERILGKPNGTYTRTNPNGLNYEIWSYAYRKHSTNPLLFVPVVGMGVVASGTAHESKGGTYTVTFDRQGMVRSIATGRTNIKSPSLLGDNADAVQIERHSTTQPGEFGKTSGSSDANQ